MTQNIVQFPLHRVRLPNKDAAWADAICEAVRGRGLTTGQVLAFVRWVEAHRVDHPHAHPSPALAFDLFDSFRNEHLIREGAG